MSQPAQPLTPLEHLILAAPERPADASRMDVELFPFAGQEIPAWSPARLNLLIAGWSYLREELATRPPGACAVVAQGFRPRTLRAFWAPLPEVVAEILRSGGEQPRALLDPCPVDEVPIVVFELEDWASCRISLRATADSNQRGDA